MVFLADRNRMHRYAPPGILLPPPIGGETAVVLDCRCGFIVHYRSVGKSVHAVGKEFPDPLGDVVAPRYDVVRSQPGHQGTVLLCGVRDNHQACMFGQLHQIVAQRSGRSGHGE